MSSMNLWWVEDIEVDSIEELSPDLFVRLIAFRLASGERLEVCVQATHRDNLLLPANNQNCKSCRARWRKEGE